MQISESLRGDKAWQALKAANQFNDPAPTGKEYVLVRLSAKVDEASDPDQAVAFHLAGFDLYSADSVQYTAFWTVVTPSPKFDGRVYQGGTLDGYLAFTGQPERPRPKGWSSGRITPAPAAPGSPLPDALIYGNGPAAFEKLRAQAVKKPSGLFDSLKNAVTFSPHSGALKVRALRAESLAPQGVPGHSIPLEAGSAPRAPPSRSSRLRVSARFHR
ncbi:MAG: hypothetical protein ACLSAF_08330 [Intestinimonas sp.]